MGCQKFSRTDVADAIRRFQVQGSVAGVVPGGHVGPFAQPQLYHLRPVLMCHRDVQRRHAVFVPGIDFRPAREQQFGDGRAGRLSSLMQRRLPARVSGVNVRLMG